MKRIGPFMINLPSVERGGLSARPDLTERRDTELETLLAMLS